MSSQNKARVLFLSTVLLLLLITVAEAQFRSTANAGFHIRNTGQALPAGLWRVRLNANTLQIDRNTATAGNFSTLTTPLSISASDVITSFGGLSVAPATGSSNGQSLNYTTLIELTTIAAAATTDTAIQIPGNAVVFAVAVRVVTTIPTAATFTVTGTTSGTTFNTAAVGTSSGTTDVGTVNCPYKNGAAQTIRFTPNLTPATSAGQVRVTIFHYTITPPTS